MSIYFFARYENCSSVNMGFSLKGLSLTISFEKRECFIFEKLFSNGAALFLQVKKESILIYKSSRSLYFCCLSDPTCDKSVKGKNKGKQSQRKEKILENTRFSRINDGARGGT